MRRSRPPNVNVTTATSISHGSRRMKLVSDVRTSSTAPTNPPARLTALSRTSHFLGVAVSSRRYAIMLESDPGQLTTVLVALATMGVTPAKSSVGKREERSAARDRIEGPGERRRR